MSFFVPRLRWWIAGFLCLLSVLNYTDRQALALLIPTIQAELHLSDAQYANVVSLFLFAYALAYLFSGRIVDYLGARVSLVLFLAVWATADFLTGLARSITLLAPARFLLGLGEAGGYLVSPKVVAEWFPSRERGVAVGFYSVGSSLGATLAPLLVIALATRYGWRSTFFITGTLALLVAATWFLLYREPRRHPLLSESERRLLPEAVSPSAGPALSERERWSSILRHPAVWALAGARLLTDPVWYFLYFLAAKIPALGSRLRSAGAVRHLEIVPGRRRRLPDERPGFRVADPSRTAGACGASERDAGLRGAGSAIGLDPVRAGTG